MKKILLVAIKGGLPQCAEPIICDDIISSTGLFCHSQQVPKIQRPLTDKDVTFKDEEVRKLLLRRGGVLWEGSHASASLSDLSLAFPMFVCGAVTSTFDALWFLQQHMELAPWTCLIAPTQTRGRGQMRREWHSPRGNMYASFILPDNPVFHHDAAAVVIGALIVNGLRALGYEVFLKWPNDIVTPDLHKVGGILLEEKKGKVIAGVGINLVSAPPEASLRHAGCLPAATLEKNILGGNFHSSPFLLCKNLVNSVIVEYTRRYSTMNFSTIVREANTLLALKDTRVRIAENAPHPVSAFCLGLGDSGGLVVRYDNGMTAEITSGSVLPESW